MSICYINSFEIKFTAVQTNIPITVGVTKETNIHFHDLVSDLTVKQVVEHGQCISINSIMLIAVTTVQPLSNKSAFNSLILPTSDRTPFDV